MSETVQVVCPHCHTANRVLRARLGDGARCGSCKEALLPAYPYELDAAGFDRHLAGNELPLVVDFWAPWCAPCRMMAPDYAEAAAQLAPQVRLAKVDTEAVPELAARFGIRGIPTLIAFSNGEEVARQAGAMQRAELIAWIKSHFKHL